MDFVSYIRDQKEKLNCREYVFHLWNELDGNNTEVDLNSSAVQDFNNHLPLLLEQFWEIAVEKLNETSTFEEIDEELKMYLLVLIYQCLTQSQDFASYNCILFASNVYLHLLTTPQTDDFYKRRLFQGVLTTIQSSVEANGAENLTKSVMHKLRVFLTKSNLSEADLEVTLATLIQLVFVKTMEVVQNFDPTPEVQTIQCEALLSLKVLLESENAPSRTFLITTYLFNGLRTQKSIHVSPRHFNLIQINFRNLLRSLHNKFKGDHYQTFMNAFIHVWQNQDFTYYSEAVIVMNSLKEKYYRTLLDVLNKMMMTKSPSRNVFKLSLAIICSPPRYMSSDKVQVTNNILLRMMLMNCLSKKSEVSNCALESLAELLISPDLEKEYIKQPVELLLNGVNDSNLNVPTILRGLQSLVSKKWGHHSKNKSLFVLMVSVILFAEEDCPQIFKEVLENLTEEASPFDLKPFIPLLTETYSKLKTKKSEFSALQILKIMFKMALHPMASSTEFVKLLYNSMVYPSVCKGMTLEGDMFIEPIISDAFDFVEFFKKCYSLGLIRTEHIAKLISNLSTIKESNLKLLCAIVHLSDYKELSVIANYINDNSIEICNSASLNYLFYVYSNILKNCSSECSNRTQKSNEIMLYFVKHQLLRQSFRWRCVPNAFALLKSLGQVTVLERDFQRLKEEYETRLATALHSKTDCLPILYYSQLVIFAKLLPNEENFNALTTYLTSDEIYRRSPGFQPKFLIACLLLYTNMSVIKSNLIDACFGYLQESLNCSVTDVKLASINMTFDLCNMLTHSFEDLIHHMFKELVYGDVVFKTTCLVKIDRLIRDDYLKLEFEQFFIFVSILGDRNVVLSDHVKQLLSENFFISSSVLISRYFVPFIVHINGYHKHPTYQISDYETVQVVSRNVLDRRKIYELLFNSLPIKCRFNIIYLLSVHILENMMKGILKMDDGFWNVIKDSIYIFKLLTSSGEEKSNENYYKKIIAHVSKNIVHKSEFTEKPTYQEYNKEIVTGTEVLLKLLFFNDCNDVQKHISICLFDAIIHWSNFLMSDLVHIVHLEKNKTIQNYYTKFEKYFTKHHQNLKYSEESFEHQASNTWTIDNGDTLFPLAKGYVPVFNDTEL